MQRCNACDRDLPTTAFYPSVPTKCRECHRAYTKAKRIADPDDMRRRSREQYRKTRAQRMEGVVRLCEQCGQQLHEQKSTLCFLHHRTLMHGHNIREEAV